VARSSISSACGIEPRGTEARASAPGSVGSVDFGLLVGGGREGLQLLKGSRGAASSTGGHWTRAEEEGSRRPNGESEEEGPTYGAPTFVENY
jgi:hypothetical protein